MKRSPIPAANVLARADGLGLRRHAIERKSPRKGTKTLKVGATCINNILIERKSPRKGTKTELSFSQMSPYVSREDPREGDERYLTWQDSGDQDPERKKDPLPGAGCLMDEEVSL